MASAKRKQDEKNLKILRELVSQPGNKECFDCHQRGPTYVNVTIGSFVCTSCSGMLRGLTPPHRVKSISMATFTQEEIDFIKERGNEYCKRIWLGLMNPNSSHELDAKDEQKMKDLMSAKYELKRYYLDPSVANQNRNQNLNQSPSQNQNQNQNQSQNQNRNQNSSQKSGTSSVPRVPSSGTSSMLSIPLRSTKISEPVVSNDLTIDFVADFSKVPDPFVGTTSVNDASRPVQPQPFFANFDNNPVFDNTKNTANTLTPLSVNGTNANKANVPPSEDRYAALKDLDSLMKRTQLKEEATTIATATTTTPAWHTDNSNASNSIWSMGNQNTRVISNPFTSGDLWRPSANLVNNNMQHIDSSLCNSANPFKPMQLPVNNVSDPQWMGIASSGNGDAMQFGQFMTPFTNKVWQPTVPAYQANPFAVGSGVSNVTRNSNNPFL